MPIVIMILWLFIGTLLILEYYYELIEINLMNRFLVMIIFLVAAPFFLISNCLEGILNILMPQGWNDDDNSEDK